MDLSDQGGNRLKERIEDDGLALGTVFYSFSPALVEVAGLAGIEWCRIDNEHAWRQDFHTESMIRAARGVGVSPILRVDKGDPNLIRKGLEAGADGVIIPHVESEAEAQSIVEAAKFPPAGERGYGSLCYSGGWGMREGGSWMTWSNEVTLIIPMIEDVEAVENVESIVEVDGVDGVLFGGSDYSVSLGLEPQPDHPRVVEGLRRTIGAADDAGKFVLCTAGYPWKENADRLMELGVSGIELGHDVTILGEIWQGLVDELK